MSARPPIAAKPIAAERRIAALPALTKAAIDTARFTIGVTSRRRTLFEKRFPQAYGDMP